jgi:hypothetical protein
MAARRAHVRGCRANGVWPSGKPNLAFRPGLLRVGGDGTDASLAIEAPAPAYLRAGAPAGSGDRAMVPRPARMPQPVYRPGRGTMCPDSAALA